MLKVGTAAVLLPVLAVCAGRAGTAVVPVQVTPAVGMPMTTFLVSFVSPVRTGVIGSIRLRYLLTAASVAPGKDCLAQISDAVPDARRGQRVRVALAPETLGGRWCTGSYRGIAIEGYSTGTQLAFVKHYLLLGQDASVRSAIDVATWGIGCGLLRMSVAMVSAGDAVARRHLQAGSG